MALYDIQPAGDDWSDPIQVGELSATYAVERAAETFWNERDGWEWMKYGAEFEARDVQTKEIWTVRVSVDFTPSFHASKP